MTAEREPSIRTFPPGVAFDPLDVAAIDEAIGVHRQKRLQLVTTIGLQGTAHSGGDPIHLVNELLRLARTGAICEARAKASYTEAVGVTVKEARDRWRLEIGGEG